MKELAALASPGIPRSSNNVRLSSALAAMVSSGLAFLTASFICA